LVFFSEFSNLPNKLAISFMYSYWDLYVEYVHHCVEYNRKHDIDPEHYEMEWNHFLPKSVFGDWPIGQYLLKKQHSIASALQSLALNKNCMCAWHIEHLPDWLWLRARPIYVSGCKEATKKLLDKRLDPSFDSEWRTSISLGLQQKWETDESYRQKVISKLRRVQPVAMVAALSEDSRQKRLDSFKRIGHQKGESNSQFGTMWVTDGTVNKKVRKGDPIPEGFSPGRNL